MIDNLKVRKAASRLGVADNKTRQRILEFLVEEPKTVTEIYIYLRVIELSMVSHHMAVLKREGYVFSRRDGKNISYRLNWAGIKQVRTIARQLAEGVL